MTAQRVMGYTEFAVDVGLMIATVICGVACFSGTLVIVLCPPRQLKDCLTFRSCRLNRPREDTDDSIDPILVSSAE